MNAGRVDEGLDERANAAPACCARVARTQLSWCWLLCAPPSTPTCEGPTCCTTAKRAPHQPPPASNHPNKQQLCAEWQELEGECFTYNCPRCHGEEELRQREAAWVAKQEAVKR